MPPTQFRMQDNDDDNVSLASLLGTTVPPVHVPAPAASSVVAAVVAASGGAAPHASGSQVRQ